MLVCISVGSRHQGRHLWGSDLGGGRGVSVHWVEFFFDTPGGAISPNCRVFPGLPLEFWSLHEKTHGAQQRLADLWFLLSKKEWKAFSLLQNLSEWWLEIATFSLRLWPASHQIRLSTWFCDSFLPQVGTGSVNKYFGVEMHHFKSWNPETAFWHVQMQGKKP